MTRPSPTALLLPVLLLLVGACASGAAATPPGSPPGSPPGDSLSPSASTVALVATADRAAELVIAADARFKGIGPKNPDLIGGCCFYEAAASGHRFTVSIEIGWGDCPSGCINRHRWSYTVTQDGSIVLDREDGPPVPAGAGGSGENGTGGVLPKGPGIAGQALAGPTCPVVQPGDPNCTDRPVAGATILIRDATGAVVAQMITDVDGRFQVKVPPGAYQVEPQPVEGLMGTADKQAVTVGTVFERVTIAYDTGIR